MKYLLDTHLLLWAAGQPEKLSPEARNIIENPANQLLFSVASLWEISIKNSLGRDDFKVNPRLLRRGLLDNGYCELAIAGEHTLSIDTLPTIHKDPFDRLLIAQAMVEGITLVTVDILVAQYPASIKQV